VTALDRFLVALQAAGRPIDRPIAKEFRHKTSRSAPAADMQDDAATLAEALRLHGPMTQGAAALLPSWDATRGGSGKLTARDN
jgi:hypothetical protein